MPSHWCNFFATKPDENDSEEDIVKIASALESESSHPIAQAFVNYANENNIGSDAIEEFKNAMDLVNNDAGILIEEKDLKEDILIKKIDEVLYDDDKLNKMKKNLEKLDINDSATIIYNNIKKLIDRK